MEILSTIWQIIWALLLIAVAVSSLALITAIFHPLRFDVRLRGSLKGQRAEVWFVYLFRMFRIGIIATPRTQDVVVSFLGWKKRLERMGRKAATGRPLTTPPPSQPSEPPPAPVSTGESLTQPGEDSTLDSTREASVGNVKQTTDDTDSSVEPQAAAQTHEEPEKKDSEQPEPSVVGSDEMPTPKQSDATQLPTEVSETTGETGKVKPVTESAETVETVEAVVSEAPPADIDSRPLKPLHEVEADYQAARDRSAKDEHAPKTSAKEGASLRQLLRKFKRDASRRFSQIKSYLRLFRRKWRALSPVFKRFWQRGKKGFGLPRTDLLLRYALHEPYLTGMSHATLAVASGMAGQWGINFVPIPHFGAPMVYSRACISAVIRPYRLLFATCALLFEKQIYLELWQLFKWYRSKKQH